MSRVDQMKQGDYFGEIALVLNAKRTCNVRATAFCELLSLRRELFEKIVVQHDGERDLMKVHRRRGRECE